MSETPGILCLFNAKDIYTKPTEKQIKRVSFGELKEDVITLDILDISSPFVKEHSFSRIYTTVSGLYYSDYKTQTEADLHQWYILYSNPKRLEKITSKTKKLVQILTRKFKLGKSIILADRVETKESVRKVVPGKTALRWIHYLLDYGLEPGRISPDSLKPLASVEDQITLINLTESTCKKTIYAVQYTFSKLDYIEWIQEYDKKASGSFDDSTFQVLISILLQAGCILCIIHNLPTDQSELKYYGAFHVHSIFQSESREKLERQFLRDPRAIEEAKEVKWADSTFQISLLNYQLPIVAPFTIFVSSTNPSSILLRTLVYEVPFFDLVHGVCLSPIATPKERYVPWKFTSIHNELINEIISDGNNDLKNARFEILKYSSALILDIKESPKYFGNLRRDDFCLRILHGKTGKICWIYFQVECVFRIQKPVKTGIKGNTRAKGTAEGKGSSRSNRSLRGQPRAKGTANHQ